jgi:hypothetical protein
VFVCPHHATPIASDRQLWFVHATAPWAYETRCHNTTSSNVCGKPLLYLSSGHWSQSNTDSYPTENYEAKHCRKKVRKLLPFANVSRRTCHPPTCADLAVSLVWFLLPSCRVALVVRVWPPTHQLDRRRAPSVVGKTRLLGQKRQFHGTLWFCSTCQ